jgi:hypothetical protein
MHPIGTLLWVVLSLVGRYSYWAPGPDRYLWYRQRVSIFSSDFLELTWEFLGIDNKYDTNLFMLRTEIVL